MEYIRVAVAGVPSCKAVSYAVRFRASDFYFSTPKIKASACCAVRVLVYQVQNMTGFFSIFENPMAQVVRFWPKIRRPGPSDFQVEKGHGL